MLDLFDFKLIYTSGSGLIKCHSRTGCAKASSRSIRVMKWFGEATSTNAKDENGADVSSSVTDLTSWTDISTIVPVLALTTLSLTSYHLYRRNLRRYSTIDHLPAAIYSRKSSRGLLGHVTSVGDGDNFRFFHTPGGRLAGWGWLRPIPTDKKDLRGATIHVRIAGVDAPELSHFGKPAQPFGQEALDWLRGYLLGRRVRVLIHSRDRFDRVVANPKVRDWPFKWLQKDVGVEQIKSGLATVFRQGGAEYGGLKEAMESAELQAKKAKRGMWARGSSLELPADYKKRTRSDGSQDSSPATAKDIPGRKTAATKDSNGNVFSKALSWARWSVGR